MEPEPPAEGTRPGPEDPATAGDGAPTDAGPDEPGGPRATPASDIARVPTWLASTTAWTWRLLVLILGAAAIITVMVRLALVTLPVIIALVLATLAVGPARALERRGLPPALAASTVVIGGVTAMTGLFAALTPAFVVQVRELVPTVIEAFYFLIDWLEQGPLGWDRDELVTYIDQGLDLLRRSSGQIAGGVMSGAAAIVQFITAFVLALVLLFFFVKDGPAIVDWILARTPPSHRATVRAVGRRAWTALSGFVRGTAAVALIDAVGIGIGLAILGVPLVLPISVLVFLGGFIPVIGAFLTGMIAVLVALAATDLQTALLTLAIVVAVQQFESNVLQPVIMRRAVSLHPIVLLGALTAGGVLIGIIGAFLAVPIAAVLAAVGNELRLRHEARQAGIDIDAEPPSGAGDTAVLASHDPSKPLGGVDAEAGGDTDTSRTRRRRRG